MAGKACQTKSVLMGNVLASVMRRALPSSISATPSRTVTRSSLTDSPGSSAKRTFTGAWLTDSREMRVSSRQRSSITSVRSTSAKPGRASGTWASCFVAGSSALSSLRVSVSTPSLGSPWAFSAPAVHTVLSTCSMRGAMGSGRRTCAPWPSVPCSSTTWMPAGISTHRSCPSPWRLASRRVVAGWPFSSTRSSRQLSAPSWPGSGTCTVA